MYKVVSSIRDYTEIDEGGSTLGDSNPTLLWISTGVEEIMSMLITSNQIYIKEKI